MEEHDRRGWKNQIDLNPKPNSSFLKEKQFEKLSAMNFFGCARRRKACNFSEKLIKSLCYSLDMQNHSVLLVIMIL